MSQYVRPWFSWSTFSIGFIRPLRFRRWPNGGRGPFVFGTRIANAYILYFFWFSVIWPLPWHPAVRDLPGYGK